MAKKRGGASLCIRQCIARPGNDDDAAAVAVVVVAAIAVAQNPRQGLFIRPPARNISRFVRRRSGQTHCNSDRVITCAATDDILPAMHARCAQSLENITNGRLPPAVSPRCAPRGSRGNFWSSYFELHRTIKRGEQYRPVWRYDRVPLTI